MAEFKAKIAERDTRADRYIDEDALLKYVSERPVEVVEGEIVEMSPVGILHHLIAGLLYDLLSVFVREHGLGRVFFDGLIYRLVADGKRLRGARVPDVSFVRKGSLPKDWDLSRPFPGAPALAVEVMSPDDEAEAVMKRVREFLRAGSEQVWVLYPLEREAHQFRRDATEVRTYTRPEDVIECADLFPGLMLPLRDIFTLPEL